MGLLSPDMKAMIEADMARIVSDNMVSIEIRRGTESLAAQNVRIARQGTTNRRQDTGNIEQSEQRVVVVGSKTLDIQKDDRFTTDDLLYEVDFVRPNRVVAVVAEARVVQ